MCWPGWRRRCEVRVKSPAPRRAVDLVRALVMSAAAALLQSVWAQSASDVPLQVETETFHFAVTGAERGAEVSGELRLPINTPQRMPLVLILHSSPVYPEATFAWDSRLGSATYDIGVNKGRGGISCVVADPEIAARSRAHVVEFFIAALKAE